MYGKQKTPLSQQGVVPGSGADRQSHYYRLRYDVRQYDKSQVVHVGCVGTHVIAPSRQTIPFGLAAWRFIESNADPTVILKLSFPYGAVH